MDPDHAHQEPSDEPSGNAIKRALERHRRSLPWSDRRILAVSLVVVLILVPVWLDPSTLTGELRDVSLLRVIGTANYAVVVRLDPSGVLVGVERTIGGQTELIGRFVSVADTSTRSSAPDMRIHAEAGGAEPTTIRVRVWPVSVPEPNVWQLTMVDWAGNLQDAGAVGLGWQSTSGASGALHFSDLTAWVTGEAAQ